MTMIPFSSSRSFDILLREVFDYAGMFPPAALSFEQALAESAELQSHLKRPWLLASDIVLDTNHARMLTEMQRAASLFSRPIRLCLLATEQPQMVADLADTLSESAACGGIEISLSSLEVKVPLGTAREVAASLEGPARKHGALLALEPELSAQSWEEALHEVVTLASIEKGLIALKCRCTGPTGIGAERLARALVQACDARIPFKVTGGFHHPIVEPTHHNYPMGFLNLAAAVALRTVLKAKATEEALCRLLTNDSASAFSFHSGLSVCGLSLTLPEIVAAKAALRFSIGSCSLREPDNDLIRLFPLSH
jgi:hypothetical protein